MDVKALLVIEDGGTFPLAQVDVLGASLLERTSDALLAAGVGEITVVSAQAEAGVPDFKSDKIRYVRSSSTEMWNDARAAYSALLGKVPATVLLVRLNAYCELDWSNFVGAHHARGERVTRVWQSATEPLDIYAVNPMFAKDTEFLIHSQMCHSRLPAARYELGPSVYSHPVLEAGDLREITEDALHMRCLLRPAGREVRPGIWMADGCRVDAGVRLVAPIFIGRHARIRTGAVVTRGSSVEHHGSVDCGTVIDNTSVLPFTTVGAGLDLSQVVVGGRKIVDLKRNVAVEIQDPTLLSEAAHNAGVRVLAKTAALVTYLPLQFWRGLTQRDAVPQLAAANAACVGDFSADVKTEKKPIARALRPELVMERYGNQ